MKRRILHIIATLDRAGAEKQLVLLASGLNRLDFEVHVCALTRGGPLASELEAREIPLTVIGKQWKYDPSAWWGLRRHIKSLQPELVQTWLFTANTYGRWAAFSAGVPHVIASELNSDPWKDWHHLVIDRYLARRSDAVIVNGQGVWDFYAEAGIATDRMRLIHGGVAEPAAAETSRDDILRELALPADSRLIGAVGRLCSHKRIEDLIWATDLLKVIREDAHLLVIGAGPRRDALARFARNCHIESHVHFLGHRNDVPRLMPHFDLLWLASGYEGLPNSVMEAMACGVPVVATDIWGNRELVVHGATGFLVPVGDRAGLARCAHKILETPDLARRLGEAGRERVRTQFTVSAMVDAHASLYREIMDK